MTKQCPLELPADSAGYAPLKMTTTLDVIPSLSRDPIFRIRSFADAQDDIRNAQDDNKKYVNMQRFYSVYIMSNQKVTVLYIGISGYLRRRVYEHKNKLTEGFTSKYNINKLLYFEHYENVNEAIKREKQLKGWRREKKINLIKTANPNLRDLSDDLYM